MDGAGDSEELLEVLPEELTGGELWELEQELEKRRETRTLQKKQQQHPQENAQRRVQHEHL